MSRAHSQALGAEAEAELSDQQSAEISTLKTTIAQLASMIIFQSANYAMSENYSKTLTLCNKANNFQLEEQGKKMLI